MECKRKINFDFIFCVVTKLYLAKIMKLNLEKILELNSLGYSQKEVLELLGINHHTTLQRFLVKNNVKLEWKKGFWKKIDHTYFESIDTELKAYLLGFFYADGTISSNGRISVRIQSDDAYIVNLFQKAMSPSIPISVIDCQIGCKIRKLQVCWRVTSKEISKSFLKLGIGPRKTYADVEFPEIPDEMYKHFIRGYFDGDGCISRPWFSKNKQGQRVTIVSTWFKLLKKIEDILKQDAEILNISYYNKKGKTCDYFCLNISSNKSCDKFYHYLYDNSNYFLERKKEKFKEHNTEIITESKESVTS